MASTINALTSGGGGLTMVGDATGNLNIQSAGSTVVAVTSAGASVTGTLAVSGGVTTPLSYVRVNTANGYGSTNTVIRRFTNVVNSAGVDVTYADSATLGATFTINTNGVYSVSYTDQFTAAGNTGLSINSTQLTTSIAAITLTDILSFSLSTSSGYTATAVATFYAAATSIVRPHTQGYATGGTPTACQFTIARVQ